MRCILLTGALVLLAACQTTGGNGYHSACGNTGPNQTGQIVGALLGALAGGYGGSHIGKGSGQLWATGAGAVLGAGAGAHVGGKIGQNQQNAQDCYTHPYHAEQRAISAPVGTTVKWDNYQTDNQGQARTLNEYQTDSGLQCREFVNEVRIGGRVEKVYGTACRQPDGSWRIIQ